MSEKCIDCLSLTLKQSRATLNRSTHAHIESDQNACVCCETNTKMFKSIMKWHASEAKKIKSASLIPLQTADDVKPT